MRTLVALLVLVTAPRLVAAAPPEDETAPYKVIVNAQNGASVVKREAVVQLFLNRRATWTNGPVAEPFDLSMTSPVREAFSREVLGMPLLAVQQYWRKRMLDLREFPPMVKASDSEVIAAVGKNPGAIGYVSWSAELPSTVKWLKISDPIR